MFQVGLTGLLGSLGAVSKAVLLLLFLFSVVSWAIIIFKGMALRRAYVQSRTFLDVFRRSSKFSEVNSVCAQLSASPLVGVFQAGYQEVNQQVRPSAAPAGAAAPGIDLVGAIRACPQPVIAAVNGTAAGAGAVIAAACDIRIAATRAKIAFLFTKVGLSGADMGAAWLLPRIVGFGRASEILMAGEFVEAEEAHRIGLFNRVVPDGEVLAAALELAARLASGPSKALAVTKRALEAESTMSLADALAAEARAQAACMEHFDFREAYEAFVAKRPARFE